MGDLAKKIVEIMNKNISISPVDSTPGSPKSTPWICKSTPEFNGNIQDFHSLFVNAQTIVFFLFIPVFEKNHKIYLDLLPNSSYAE